jgi:multiple antibiotic resistance protein
VGGVAPHGSYDWRTLFAALPINRLIGKTGINVATRVMALFVAAIGVNFIFTGIRVELPGLTR